MKLKRCTGCGEEKPATTEFYSAFRIRSGKETLSSRCKPCKAAFTREYNRKNYQSRREILPKGFRRCSKCKITFLESPDYFHRRQKGRDDLLVSICKTCTSEKSKNMSLDSPLVRELRHRRAKSGELKQLNAKQRLHLLKLRRHDRRESSMNDPALARHLDGIRQRHNEQRRNRTPEQRAYANEKSKEWNNKNRTRARPQSYYGHYSRWLKAEHPKKYEEYRLKNLRKMKDNPEKNREKSRLRRARKYEAPGSFTEDDVKRKMSAQQYKCCYCSRSLKRRRWAADHIVPLSRGGSNYPDNIAVACITCNSSKHNKLLGEWQPPKPLAF